MNTVEPCRTWHEPSGSPKDANDPRRTTDPLPEKDTPLTREEIARLKDNFSSALVQRLLATIEQRDRIYAAIQTDADPAGTLREVVELRDLVGQLSEHIRFHGEEDADLKRRVREFRGTAEGLLRQRDEALRGWSEVAEALGCTEDEDSVAGAVRDLKKRVAEAERLSGEKSIVILDQANTITKFMGQATELRRNHAVLLAQVADLQSRELTEEGARTIATIIIDSTIGALRGTLIGTVLPSDRSKWVESAAGLILSARGSR